MKKLKKSAKIILVSVVSALCVLGIVFGCVFATRGNKPGGSPNNPNTPITPEEPKTPAISYIDSGKINSFKASPFENICDSEDVLLLGSNYFIFNDELGNKHLAVFKNENGAFKVDVLTSDKFNFVKEGAREFSVVAYNDNYAVIKSIFDQTSEIYQNETYSVVYYGGDTPVEVYQISTNSECDLYFSPDYLGVDCLYFERFIQTEENADVYSLEFSAIKLNKSKVLSEEDVFNLYNDETINITGSDNKAYETKLINGKFGYYVLGNELGISTFNNNEFILSKFEINPTLVFDIYQLTSTKFLFEYSENEQIYEYFYLDLKNDEFVKTDYNVTIDYVKINDLGYVNGTGIYYICEQKYLDERLEQHYLYTYYDSDSQVIARYESTSARDLIQNSYDGNRYCTKTGIYKKESGSNNYNLEIDFTKDNYSYITSNKDVVVLGNNDDYQYIILLANENFKKLETEINLKFSQVSSVYENQIIFGASTENQYLFNTETKEFTQIENVVNFEDLIYLTDTGYYVTSENEVYDLYFYNNKITSFTTFEKIKNMASGYVINFYNNEELVYIISTDTGSYDSDYENFGFYTSESIANVYTVNEVTAYSSFSVAHGSGTISESGAWNNRTEKYEIIMDKGYKFKADGSAWIEVDYANRYKHYISDKSSYSNGDSSGTWNYSRMSDISFGWKGENRRYYAKETGAKFVGGAAFISNHSGEDTTELITYQFNLYYYSSSNGYWTRYDYWWADYGETVHRGDYNGHYAKTGYTFTGYYDSSSGGTQYIASNGYGSKAWDKSGSFVYALYAHYRQNTYTINFAQNKPSNATNSVSGKVESITGTYDSNFSLPSSKYSLTGWTFLGWSTSSSATSATYSAGQYLYSPNFTSTDGGSVTLYAVWRANTYKVTLSANYGTIGSRSVASGSSGLTLSGTTFTATYDQTAKFTFTIYRIGYTFSGWSSSLSYGSISTDRSAITNGTYKDTTSYVTLTTTFKNLTSTDGGSVTLTASWSQIYYYIQLSANGGEISNLSAGTNASLSGNLFYVPYYSTSYIYNNIKRDGYVFTGWMVSGTGLRSGRVVTPSFTTVDETTTSIRVTTYSYYVSSYRGAVMTFTAQWSPISYFIDYDSNKPSKASSTVQGTVATTSMIYDSTTTALAKNNFTLTGWTFRGWSQNPNASDPTYLSGATPSRLNATTLRGGSVTMYAIWKPNTYTITFNGGSGALSNFSAVSGLTAVGSSSFTATYDNTGVFTNSAVRTGYMFNGWSISTNRGSANAVPNSAYSTFNEYYSANPNTTNSASIKTSILNLTPTNGATVTLTAKWTAISYYVKLDSGASDAYISNLGVVSNAVLSGSQFRLTYQTTGVIKSQIKRDGYTFNGWQNGGGGTVSPSYTTIDDTTTSIKVETAVLNLTYIYNDVITLTARWTPIKYYISIDGNSGSVSGIGALSNLTLSNSKFEATYDLLGTLTAKLVRNGYKLTNLKNTGTKGTTSTIPYNSSYSDFSAYYQSNPETKNSAQVRTTALNLTTTRGATVTLSAEWSAISYTLQYLSNKPSGSTYSPVGTTSNSFATYDQVVTFSMNGYSIIGWTNLGWSDVYSDTTAKFASGGSARYNFTTVDQSTVSIYAIWRKNNYTISYVLNGGTKTGSKTYTERAQFDTPFLTCAPERIGYTFARYTISGMSTNNEKYVGLSNPPTSKLATDVTTYNMTRDAYYKNLTSVDEGIVYFEAFWTPNQYSIAYDYNTGKADSSGTYPTRATFDMSFSVTAPIKLGYTFTGWNISGMDTVCTHYYGTSTTELATITQTLATTFKNLRATDATVKFTATWKANIYNVKYDFTGGGEASGLSYPKTLTFDSVSTISNPVRTGYTFIGWYISNMSKTCTHYYGKSADNLETTENDYLSITDIGYTAFKNLHSETDATVNFKANWTPNTYKITYKYDQKGLTGAVGADNNPSSAVFDTVFSVKAPTVYPFGYHFNGWILSNMSTTCEHYYGITSNNVTNSTGAVSEFKVDANVKYFKNLHSESGATVTLIADWAPNAYNIEYVLKDARGGDGHFDSSNPAPQTAEYDTQFTIPTPIRTGYTFIGWSFSGLADYGDDVLLGKLPHYYSKDNIAFVSTNGSYAKDETNTNAVINSDTFKNLHYQTGAIVTLTANWRANNYTITYHYLSSDFDTTKLTASNINTYIYESSWRTKTQRVTYDSAFTTMKMAKSDSDTTGVVIPDDVKIIYWIFYSSPVESNHRFASNDESQNTIPEHDYYLGVGAEYVYSSYELFNTYPLFGSDVHAYAIYGFTNITLKFYGGNSKIDFNNIIGYTFKQEMGTRILGNVLLPTSIGSQRVLGYMISSNAYETCELNVGSITTYTLASGEVYTAKAGTTIKWGYSSSLASNPEDPTFYLYAIYDTSIKNFYTPQIYKNDGVYQAIGFNTVGMFTAGKTYSITISGLENVSYYDYQSIKLARTVNSNSGDSSVVAFDEIYAHQGVTSSSRVNISGFNASVPNSTTLTVTFTADSNTKNFSLYLFYGLDKNLNVDSFIKDLRIVIQEVKS